MCVSGSCHLDQSGHIFSVSDLLYKLFGPDLDHVCNKLDDMDVQYRIIAEFRIFINHTKILSVRILFVGVLSILVKWYVEV